jgi:hypothetical protein
LKVEVGNKKFDLTKVSIYISELYGELSMLAFGHSDLIDKLNDASTEYELDVEEAQTKADKLRARLKHSKRIREIRAEGDEITKDIYSKRFDVLKELLELNGYDFNLELWRKNSDKEQINDILVELVGGGSKKKAASST